jgi:hypothetical protein
MRRNAATRPSSIMPKNGFRRLTSQPPERPPPHLIPSRDPPMDRNARPAFMPQVDQRAGRAPEAIAASLLTNPCGKHASLRSRLVARPRCPRSSGGNSERDGRWALPFGFGRTTGSRPLGRANRPARHTASLPSSLPVCLSCPCGALRSADWSNMVTDDGDCCEVAHRRKNLLAHPRKRVRLVRWNRSARGVVNAPVNEMKSCLPDSCSRMHVPGSAGSRSIPHRP